ncbi:MAG: glutaminase A [Verrucomicrobiota bacterium]
MMNSTISLPEINLQKSRPSLHTPLHVYLEKLLDELRDQDDGAMANYIPELAKANPDWFGISICTADGEVYEAGDSDVPFTIQSMSKPLVYGQALDERSVETVMRRVGVEPSGEAFNSISLHPKTNCPLNPMINAGAITVTGLIQGSSEERRFQRIASKFGDFMGRRPELDVSVFESESATGHRNRAIAHMLRNFDLLEDPVEESLNVYFRQCSLLVNCRDLSVIGATLANSGVNPVTGIRALKDRHVPLVLSVMTSCGMYDFAGSWFYYAGIPAKSGVSGGIIGVLPGRLGIGVYSPRLDEMGNSVRGVKAITEVSRKFGLHLFNSPFAAGSVIRTSTFLGQTTSRQVRPASEARAIRQHGQRVRVMELQGDMRFSSLELLQRDTQADIDAGRHLLLDLRLVRRMDSGSLQMWTLIIRAAAAAGVRIGLSGLESESRLQQHLAHLADRVDLSHVMVFNDLDSALEWFEDDLLRKLAPDTTTDYLSHETALGDMLGNIGLNPTQCGRLEAVAQQHAYAIHEVICEQGARSDRVYFLAKGMVSVRLQTRSGASPRLAAFHAGMSFGELALIDGGTRSSSVIAESTCIVYELELSALEEVFEAEPEIKILLLTHFASDLARRLRQANREIAALVG